MEHIRGRLAPSPSGRMHLGNALSALIAWLSVRSQNGELVLRLEDLDRERCKREYSLQLMDDLKWLGLDWDISGDDYYQSNRGDIYDEYLLKLDKAGLVYPCFCTRAQRLAASAPHLGESVGAGHCACFGMSADKIREKHGARHSLKLQLSCDRVEFTDRVFGKICQPVNCHGGDIILRRSDGMFAYQLAVVVDDGLMGINQVVRGRDLLDSTPVQIHLHRLLGFTPPEYMHIPLLLAPDGKRLAKRERSLDMGSLRKTSSPEEIIGFLAFASGIIEKQEAVSARELISIFTADKIKKEDIYLPASMCQE